MSKLLYVCAVTMLGAGLSACSNASSPASPSATGTALSAEAPLAAKPDWATAAKPGSQTIVQIVLADDGEFDVLQAAVVRAGLADLLGGPDQFTVFAPTDAAFVTTLGVADEAAAIAAVNALPLADLTNILGYHVTNGRRTSRSVLAAPRYEMLNGGVLTRDALVAAGIAKPDISASNGIIHVINHVLLP